MRKNTADNSLIYIIAGALALLLGVVVVIVADGEVGALIVGIICLLCGVGIIALGVLKMLALSKAKKLKNNPDAFATEAKFEDVCNTSTVSVGLNIRIGFKRIGKQRNDLNLFKKVKYTYTDQNGVSHTVKSLTSYTPSQVDFLREKGTFKILCDSNVSIIVEELPEE